MTFSFLSDIEELEEKEESEEESVEDEWLDSEDPDIFEADAADGLGGGSLMLVFLMLYKEPNEMLTKIDR